MSCNEKYTILLIVDEVEPVNMISDLLVNFNVLICNLFVLKEQLMAQPHPDLFIFLHENFTILESTINRNPYCFRNSLEIMWWPQNSSILTKNVILCSERGIEYLEYQQTQLNIAKIKGRLNSNTTSKKNHLREAYIQGSNIKGNKHDEMLDDVHRYLNEKNLDSDFSIEKMGTDLGMSRTKFFSKVKLLTGSSPSRMVMNYRLKKGAYLIKESNKNISDVAFEVGFSSIAYFTKCFKKKFGKNPSQYSKSRGKIIESIGFTIVNFEESSIQA